MSIAALAFVGFGVACIAFGVAHEFTWFRRRGGVVVKGIIVEIIKDPFPSEGGPYYHPRIEYSVGEQTRNFVSNYGDGEPAAIGTIVDVSLSPNGKDAEVLTSRNRLLISVLSFAFGALFIAIGLGIRPW